MFLVVLTVSLFITFGFILLLPRHAFVDLTVGIMILAKVNGHRNFAAVHVTAVAIRAGRPYQRTQVPFLFLWLRLLGSGRHNFYPLTVACI